MTLSACRDVRKTGEWSDAYDLVTLTYDERFLRRKKLTTKHNEAFLVDLAHTTSPHLEALPQYPSRLPP